MNILKKLLLIFIINCLFLSLTDAYNLSSIEKEKGDTIVGIIEQKISQNGESTRQIYIKSLNKIKINKNEKIKAIIDYVLLYVNNKSYDLSYLFSDKDINSYSKKCSKDTTIINGIKYNIPTIDSGHIYRINYQISIENGYIDYYNNYSCENGVLELLENKIYVRTQCDDGYTLSLSSCVLNTNINNAVTLSNLGFEKTYWDLKKGDIVQLGSFKVNNNNNNFNTYNINITVESLAISGGSSTKSRLTFSDIYFVYDIGSKYYSTKYYSTEYLNSDNFLNMEGVGMSAQNYKMFGVVNEATPGNDEITTTIYTLVGDNNNNTGLYNQKIGKITVWK